MKDYNEMAKSVFEKRDEYLIAQKKRRAMLLKAGVPLCSLVLVTLVSLIVWQAKLPEMPKKPSEPTINITEQVKPDDTSKGTINSVSGEIKETQYSSVQALQSAVHSADGGENIPKPTQIIQQGTENKPQDDIPVVDKPAVDTTVPQPNTGGVAYPNSPEANGKPSGPLAPPTGGDDYSDSPLATLPGGEVATLPIEPEYPYPDDPTPTVGIEYTTDGSGFEEPTTANCEDLAPVPATKVPEPTVPETTAPESTGPLEITVEDKTVVAQVGDKVTYTIELEADRMFENIHTLLEYGKGMLEVVVPTSDEEDDFGQMITAPNVEDAVINYNRFGRPRQNDTVVMVASRVSRYDFRNRKLLLRLEFVVKKGGRLEMDFWVNTMSIDGTDVYFENGNPVITEGIKFYQCVVIK